MDASVKDAGRARIPTLDAQVPTTDPVPQCDRSDPNGCPPGETCDLVLRRAAGSSQFEIYTGCVVPGRERGAGDPCDPDPTNAPPYQAPGLTDEVYREPCGPGLTCAPDRKIRNAASCQTLCSTGGLGDTPIACQSPTAICFPAISFGSNYSTEYCREADGCDATKQTGCLEGEACYVVPSDDLTQYLSLCSPAPSQANTTADGAQCSFLSCKAGSVCLGPVHLPPSRWTQTDLACRPLCTAPIPGDEDAGTDDGGVSSGGCASGKTCQPFGESGLGVTNIPKPPYGQCE